MNIVEGVYSNQQSQAIVKPNVDVEVKKQTI